MADFADYLRDKLEHADDLVCRCPLIDTTTYFTPASMRPRMIRGFNPACPIHGIDGTEPTYPTIPIEPDPEIWMTTEPISPRRRWWRR